MTFDSFVHMSSIMGRNSQQNRGDAVSEEPTGVFTQLGI